MQSSIRAALVQLSDPGAEATSQAQDMTNRRVKIKADVDAEQMRNNRTKSRVRAKVEWPFRILKRVFGYIKVRYRSIKSTSILAKIALAQKCKILKAKPW